MNIDDVLPVNRIIYNQMNNRRRSTTPKSSSSNNNNKRRNGLLKWVTRIITVGLSLYVPATLTMYRNTATNNTVNTSSSNGSSNRNIDTPSSVKSTKKSFKISLTSNDYYVESATEDDLSRKIFPGPISSTAYSKNYETNTEEDTSKTITSLPLLDSAVGGLLPRLFPARFQVCPRTANSNNPYDFETVYAVAEWELGSRRMYGNDADGDIYSKDTQNNGNLTTVVGDWPDTITSLSYIPILKNAHTSLSRVFRKLRYKLSNANVTVFNKQNRRRFYANRRRSYTQPSSDSVEGQWERQGNENQDGGASSTIYFTVLRDPIDRFISTTCQDLRDGKNSVPIHRCFIEKKEKMSNEFISNTGEGKRTRTSRSTANRTTDDDNVTLLESMRCLVRYIMQGKYTHHQRPQSCQLRDVMSGLDEPVNIIPFDRLDDLYRDLGTVNDDDDNNKRVRNRHSPEYVKGGGDGHHKKKSDDLVASFCSQGMELLSQRRDDWNELRNRICTAYSYDVMIMRAANMEIPLCPMGL